MAIQIKDRVQETTTTTGTGSLTMLGAVSGYQSFNSALSSGDTCYYAISDTVNGAWEVGLGTFTSTETLARTTILASSNSGSVVTLAAGTKQVFLTYPASELALLAPLASPAFTGVPTAPTATAGTDSTQVATTAYVDSGPGTIGILPGDLGWKAWTFDPQFSNAQGTVPAFGQPYGSLIKLYAGVVTTGAQYVLGATVGSSATHAYIGLYNMSGTLVAVTADLTTTMNSNANTAALAPWTGTYTVGATGLYYVALLIVGAGTLPTFSASSGGGNEAWDNVVNVSSPPKFRWCQLGGLASQTTLPGSLTIASNQESNTAIWFGVY